jgi:hypothetical protein
VRGRVGIQLKNPYDPFIEKNLTGRGSRVSSVHFTTTKEFAMKRKMTRKMTHAERITVKSAIREAVRETKDCSPFMRLVALTEARDTLKEDGIILPMRKVVRLAEAV